MRQTSVESYLRTIKKDLEENSLLLSKEIDDATRDSIKHFVFSTLNALRSCVEYSYQDVIDLVIEPNVLPHVDEKLKKKLEETPRIINFPYRASDISKITSDLYVKKITSIDSRISELIKDMQPFADPHKKTVFKVFDLSNDLKHDDSVEEIKENSTFEVVKGNVRKPLMSIENSSYITIAGFDVAGDIDLKNTRNITVVNSRAGNIRGHNAKKNLIIGSKVGGKKLSIMTDLELEITEDNKVLIKKDGTEVFQLISDAIPLIENFTGKLYAILNGPKA